MKHLFLSAICVSYIATGEVALRVEFRQYSYSQEGRAPASNRKLSVGLDEVVTFSK